MYYVEMRGLAIVTCWVPLCTTHCSAQICLRKNTSSTQQNLMNIWET